VYYKTQLLIEAEKLTPILGCLGRVEPVAQPATTTRKTWWPVLFCRSMEVHLVASKEEEQLRFQAKLLDAVGQSVIATDLEGKVLYWNRGAQELYGWSPGEALERNLRVLTVPEELLDQAEAIRSELWAGRTWSGEMLLRRKDGSHVSVLGTATPFFDDRGNLAGMIGVSTDISERKALEAELERRASHDPLTGLPNRHTLVDRLGQALLRTKRGKEGRKVGVLFMDLDGFKTINDSLGHEAGDRLLVTVAERLRKRLRPEDVLARFGGDEFAVLLEEVADASETIRVAQRIAESLREPFTVNDHQVNLSTSVGIALGSAHTKDDPEGMLRNADAAMYKAKEQGLGCYAVFDPAMQTRAQERLELEAELRRALEQGEFVLYYQPEVSLYNGSMVGLEALLRWQHPERGLLKPSAFVPLAEETDVIAPIGRWVLEEACRQAKRWEEEHPLASPMTMEVNLSSKQLRRRELARTVEEALTRAGVEAHTLALDITETVLIGASEHNAQALEALKKMGIRLSLDDFGTGYSSLSYLKRLPVDRVKVDRSFVKGLGGNATDTAVVRMIIELCHTLGVEVLAEGVETSEQAALLKDMGCDVGQGYYFARPLRSEELAEQLPEPFLQ
jgi:diguanylate cyclase (GGDEF)-like protein/PAS domain S-box-containing protein